MQLYSDESDESIEAININFHRPTSESSLVSVDGDNISTKPTTSTENCSRPLRFRNVRRLGSGSFGEVYIAYDNFLLKWVAVKKFKALLTKDEGIAVQSLREISILRRLTYHINICQLLDVIDQNDWAKKDVLLVLEVADNDLDSWMTNNTPSLETARYVSFQILKGCEFLHQNRIMHR